MNQLAMFVKYWQPGRVKTRLAAAIGETWASRLQRAFVEVLVQRFQRHGDRRVLAYTPASRAAEFAPLSEAWELEAQGEGDLGERIERHFARGLARAERCVLIGSDSPNLPAKFVDDAFDALKFYPVVLGPTTDGGYCLIGLQTTRPDLFRGIDWSTARVWDQTTARLQAARIPFATLPAWYDVDVIDDLRRLERDLCAAPAGEAALAGLRTVVSEAICES